MFRDRCESLEDAGALGFDAPAQIEVVDLGVGPLEQILVSALMLLIVFLVEHGCDSAWCVGSLMVQTVLFLLNELLSQRREK